MYEVLHVADVGYVVYGHLVTCQQRGTDYLQGFVLRSLRRDGALQLAFILGISISSKTALVKNSKKLIRN